MGLEVMLHPPLWQVIHLWMPNPPAAPSMGPARFLTSVHFIDRFSCWSGSWFLCHNYPELWSDPQEGDGPNARRTVDFVT